MKKIKKETIFYPQIFNDSRSEEMQSYQNFWLNSINFIFYIFALSTLGLTHLCIIKNIRFKSMFKYIIYSIMLLFFNLKTDIFILMQL